MVAWFKSECTKKERENNSVTKLFIKNIIKGYVIVCKKAN